MSAVAVTVEPPRRKWVISMDLERISSLSLEQLRFPVFADAAGAPVNPTSYTVQVAFMAASNTNPAVGDWKAGGWDTTIIGTYVATVLVGPGGVANPAPGTWYVWVQINTGTEIIVRQVGELEVD